MFGFRKKVADDLGRAPVMVAEVEDPKFMEQYVALASKLGISNAPDSHVSPLIPVLHDLGIGAYDREKVERYLDKKGYWAWFPMRAQDIGPDRQIERKTTTSYSNIFGPTRASIYRDAIPYPVLLTVERIMERLPDATFLVAAIDKHPDPFLAVLMPSHPGEVFIIERWDEPSFRG